MNEKGQETEVKFCVRDLHGIEGRLHDLGAQLHEPRVLEVNLRFDTPNRELMEGGRVLRLRQDRLVHLTYKGGSQLMDGVRSRREIEFTVEDFEAARQLIEALGYDVVFRYEKYRTTYQMRKTFIMLDELPYGNFVEIEGEFGSLHEIAEKLGLNWEAAIPASYQALFERLSKSRGFSFHDSSFEKLKGLEVSPDEMAVRYADFP